MAPPPKHDWTLRVGYYTWGFQEYSYATSVTAIWYGPDAVIVRASLKTVLGSVGLSVAIVIAGWWTIIQRRHAKASYSLASNPT